MNEKLPKLIRKIYKITQELEEMYQDRPFTLDGHLLGSIGECYIAEKFNLKLMPPSNKGYDAVSLKNQKVEIKITQTNKVGFRETKPDFVIVMKVDKKGDIDIIYNGPGNSIWSHFKKKKTQSNGQKTISISLLKKMNEQVNMKDKISK